MQETSAEWIHEEVVGIEEIHFQDCLLQVRYHKGPREAITGKEGHAEGSCPICGDKGWGLPRGGCTEYEEGHRGG